MWVLPRNAVAVARVGVSLGVIDGLIGVVVVCLGSFRVGNLGEMDEIACFGSYRCGVVFRCATI